MHIKIKSIIIGILLALATLIITIFVIMVLNYKEPTMPNSSQATNALLNKTDHPTFQQIEPAHFDPAINQLIANYKQVIAKVTQLSNPTWISAIQPLEEASEAIDSVWNVIAHLNSVQNTDSVRQAYEVVLAKITDFFTEIMQNEQLYQTYLKVQATPEFSTLTKPQQTIIEHAIRDFKLAGVTLPPEQRARFKEIQQRQSELSNQFSNNVLDASQGWNYFVPADLAEVAATPEHNRIPTKLSGLPEHTLALAASKAEQTNRHGWLLTLDFPCYYAITTYADDAELRKLFYQAYVTRASDQGPLAGKWDNSQIMAEILQLRQEEAKLIGFNNYAEFSLATKMAQNTQQVVDFLQNLVRRSKPQAEREYQELADFARQQYGVTKLEVWDMSYYAEKYQQQHYQISSEQVRPYFPEPKVLAGMFNLVHRLFGITIKEITGSPNIETWDKHVRVFEVTDANNEVRGKFYADLYTRDYKKSGAWMADLLSRGRFETGAIQTPIAFLVANLTPPIGNKPALLAHDEIITLFHEFGHTIHHILTKVDFFSVSGTNGVAWDAVELPSQFMENWCWEWEVIKEISGHHETGAPLPKTEFDKLYATKNFQAALQMLRQLQFALFDFQLHLSNMQQSAQGLVATSGTLQGQTMQQILDTIRQQTSVVPVPNYNRFQHSFSHIFAGGYAAGYYSYLWAEVLSSDAFEMFKEHGTFNQEIGQRFLRTILEQGGSRDAMDLFIEFRGRTPQLDALLKHSGIIEVNS